MKKKYTIIGCIVILLLLSSASIAVAKDLSDFRYKDCNSNIGVGYDNAKRPQPQIVFMNDFAHAHSPSSSPHPHTSHTYQNYHGPYYGDWHTSALNAKGKDSLQLNYANDTCRMNFSNEGNTPVNITYNVSISSNHHLSGCHGKLALGAGESREISENIPVRKDSRNLAFQSEIKIGLDSNSKMFFRLISWHSVSSVSKDSEEVDMGIND